ncbi:STM3941 family protein [Nocardia mangyaensis]|uniref:STM3941 family protein n=1 Tax=Nocardia mangyaensis TaxID=2213200 RepID=UPI003B82E196
MSILVITLLITSGMTIGFALMTSEDSLYYQLSGWIGIPLTILVSISIMRRIHRRAPGVVISSEYIEVYNTGKVYWNTIERVSVWSRGHNEFVEIAIHPHLNPAATTGMKARLMALIGKSTPPRTCQYKYIPDKCEH